MKKMMIGVLLLMCATPVWADILLSPEEEVAAKQHMEQGQKNCPLDKPLFDGEKCHACGEPEMIWLGRYGRCSEICPNRKSTYRHGRVCVLKNS
ncbi:MAG: hypothetical protein J6Y85_04110 [Alphaproteobacteria bacterium]|nr:hypothetical protein [Alphaproteobacteria bacterium]